MCVATNTPLNGRRVFVPEGQVEVIVSPDVCPKGWVRPYTARCRARPEAEGARGLSPGLNGASMKPPTLSRPAGKLFLLFLIHFGRHLTITHLFGFGVDHAAAFTPQ
jgi:hypothetical protein